LFTKLFTSNFKVYTVSLYDFDNILSNEISLHFIDTSSFIMKEFFYKKIFYLGD